MLNKFSQSQLEIAVNMAAYMRYGVPFPYFAKKYGDYYWFPTPSVGVVVINKKGDREIKYWDGGDYDHYHVESAVKDGKEIKEAEFWKNYNEALYFLESKCHKRHEFITGITHVADLPKP